MSSSSPLSPPSTSPSRPASRASHSRSHLPSSSSFSHSHHSHHSSSSSSSHSSQNETSKSKSEFCDGYDEGDNEMNTNHLNHNNHNNNSEKVGEDGEEPQFHQHENSHSPQSHSSTPTPRSNSHPNTNDSLRSKKEEKEDEKDKDKDKRQGKSNKNILPVQTNNTNPLTSASSSPSSFPSPSASPSPSPSSPPDLLSLLQHSVSLPPPCPHTEDSLLDKFLHSHSSQYSFNNNNNKQYRAIFILMVQNRLPTLVAISTISSTSSSSPPPSPSHCLRILRSLRVFTRDSSLQRIFMKLHGHHMIANYLNSICNNNSNAGAAQHVSLLSPSKYSNDILIEVVSILKRISSNLPFGEKLLSSSSGGNPVELIQNLLYLLDTNDQSLLTLTLLTMLSLTNHKKFIEIAAESNAQQRLFFLINATMTSTTASPAVKQKGDQSQRGNSNNPPLQHSNSQPTATTSSPSSSSPSPSAPLPSSSSSSLVPRPCVLSAELLDSLVEVPSVRHDLLLLNVNSSLLHLCFSTVHSYDFPFSIPLLRLLATMSIDFDSTRDIRLLGGISILLEIFTFSLPFDLRVSMGSVVILTQMCLDEDSAAEIRKSGGIVTIAAACIKVIKEMKSHPSPPSTSSTPPPLSDDFLLYSFRCLRFLYSLERNRSLFKRFLPSSLFSIFIDLAPFTHDIALYKGLMEEFKGMDTEGMEQMEEQLRRITKEQGGGGAAAALLLDHEDTSRPLSSASAASALLSPIFSSPSRVIRGYRIMDVIGQGAFGTVYQVRKISVSGTTGEDENENDQLFALKELPLSQYTLESKEKEEINKNFQDGNLSSSTSFSPSDPSENKNLQRLIASLCGEVEILSQLDHSNIVRYYHSFVSQNNLYIVMEYVDGLSLQDYCQSLSDKGAKMSEETIWKIFTQLCLALSYLHSEKRIVHRDLTPSNIILSDGNRRVLLADFGLARQTHNDTILQSSVGTISFSCPEIVQNIPYTEKADCWSLGAILYQMVTLSPPFMGSNPLTVAQKIVSGNFNKNILEERGCSALMKAVIGRLLTVDTKLRPDITQLSALISPILMKELERKQRENQNLKGKLDSEKDGKMRIQEEINREKAQRRALTRELEREREKWKMEAEESNVISPDSRGNPTSPFPSPSPTSTTSSRDSHSSAFQFPSAASSSSSSSSLLSDPSTRLLRQLHKLIYVTQLPPRHDVNSQLISHYKKKLFSFKHFDIEIKSEISSLAAARQAEAAITLMVGNGNGNGNGSGNQRRGSVSSSVITYKTLHDAIEQILHENNYYAEDSASTLSTNSHKRISSTSSSSIANSNGGNRKGSASSKRDNDNGDEDDGNDNHNGSEREDSKKGKGKGEKGEISSSHKERENEKEMEREREREKEKVKMSKLIDNPKPRSNKGPPSSSSSSSPFSPTPPRHPQLASSYSTPTSSSSSSSSISPQNSGSMLPAVISNSNIPLPFSPSPSSSPFSSHSPSPSISPSPSPSPPPSRENSFSSNRLPLMSTQKNSNSSQSGNLSKPHSNK